MTWQARCEPCDWSSTGGDYEISAIIDAAVHDLSTEHDSSDGWQVIATSATGVTVERVVGLDRREAEETAGQWFGRPDVVTVEVCRSLPERAVVELVA